ncbi:MAG: signal recognition particle subunit SRP19/SEC65 family protein [Candidatus Heimdallarchaeaceae archaeon]|jgi:signal recognition particle subunit SRP19
MLRRKKYFVLYPEYFNKSLTRKQGRILPKNKAVENCTLSKIVYACKHLELDFEVEKDKKYSKSWWASDGRVIVNPEGIDSKTDLIRRVANISRKLKKVEKAPDKKKKKSTSKK